MEPKANEESDIPSEAAVLERAFSLVNEAMHTVALQLRRVRSVEPEDESFLTRYWADLQFFIVALRRLRRAGELAARVPAGQSISSALADFDAAIPSLMTMRNVGEHIDDYALDSKRRRDKTINRRMLQVGSWDGTTYHWLDQSLNVDEAHAAAFALYAAVRTVLKSYMPS